MSGQGRWEGRGDSSIRQAPDLVGPVLSGPPLQCFAVGASLLSLAENLTWPWLPTVRDILLWLAVGVTIWSGLIYVIRGFSLLRQE